MERDGRREQSSDYHVDKLRNNNPDNRLSLSPEHITHRN